ncbi:MAG: hypothetical protein JW714_05420 [Candidatus Omnitrophica bacterium]|nr:hypothetical protein [Candidatus Omnitrophota bacterium]
MNKALKGGSVLWLLVTIISLLAAGAILFLMLQEKAKRVEIEEKLLTLTQAKQQVDRQLNEKQMELIKLKDQARILSDQWAKERQSYEVTLEQKNTRLSTLETDLANEKQQRMSLANSLAQLKENYADLEGQLTEARLKLEGQQKGPGEKGPVELRRIIVKPKKKLDGKVLIVNREFRFVVIDLGKKDGVAVGDEFRIYQGSAEVGKAQVERVYESMATAAILPGSLEEEIAEDSIVKSL